MKIIDCFTFYNELTLLEYRLAALNDVVDYFILVEARQTYVGHPKPLFYDENKDRFAKYANKLIHVIIDLPYVFPNINYKNYCPFMLNNYMENGEQWINETYQRHYGITAGINYLYRQTTKTEVPESWVVQTRDGITPFLDIYDNDKIIVSDLDEIPNPDILSIIKTNNSIFDFYKLEIDLYHYNLHNKLNEKWYHSFIMSHEYFTKLYNLQTEVPSYCFIIHMPKLNERMFLTELRLALRPYCDFIIKGGWHLSFFGDAKFVANKIMNYSHVEACSGKPPPETDIEKQLQKFSFKTPLTETLMSDNDDLNCESSMCKDVIIPSKNVSLCDNTFLPPLYETYLRDFY